MLIDTHYDNSREIVTLKIPLEIPLAKKEYEAIQKITKNRFAEFYQVNGGGRINIEKNHVIRLNLSGLELGVLDKSIGDFKELGKLFVRDNHLMSLPESIGNLKHLTWFGATYNPLDKASLKLIEKLGQKGVVIEF